MIRTIIDLIGFFNSLSGFLVAVVFLEYTYHYLCQKYKKACSLSVLGVRCYGRFVASTYS